LQELISAAALAPVKLRGQYLEQIAKELATLELSASSNRRTSRRRGKPAITGGPTFRSMVLYGCCTVELNRTLVDSRSA